LFMILEDEMFSLVERSAFPPYQLFVIRTQI